MHATCGGFYQVGEATCTIRIPFGVSEGIPVSGLDNQADSEIRKIVSKDQSMKPHEIQRNDPAQGVVGL